jgi:DNA-binding winged helix-turn-helix (wHTH) protein/Tol biopolymer transport system component
MLSREPTAESVAFGCFEVNLATGEVFRNGRRLRLSGQPSQVLLILLQRAGQLVPRDELRLRLWPDETFVDFDHGLNNCINRIRDLLGDSAANPRFIETLPKQGYRFIAPIRILDAAIPQSPDGHDSAANRRVIASSRDPKVIEKVRRYPFIAPVEILSELSPSLIPSAENGAQTVSARSVPARPTAMLFAAACILAIILIPIAIFLIYRVASKHGAPLEPHLAEQRVTSNSPEAPVDSAVVSPDGKFAAYADPTGLYLRVIASGEIRRWDLPKSFIAKPNSWFPDGTHLLVMRWEGTPPTPSLWKLSLLGASPQKLIDSAVSGSVSPDGTRIAFGTFLPSWGSELWVMGADGSNPHKIAEASQRADPSYPSGILSSAWSPNSRRIACIERYGFAGLTPATDLSTLWTRDDEGGDLQVIFKNTLLGPALSWAQDGRILFASRSNPASERDNEDLSSIRVDERTGKAAGQQQVVTTGAGAIGGISVTSDGKRLMLWRTNSREQAFISEFDANTRKWKTPRRLTLDANGNQATAWLSDSRTVLFVSNRNGSWTLFKQPIDETTADVLVEGHSLYLPRLSADGSQVLYGSQPDPTNPFAPVSLMRLPVAGGPPQLVVRGVGLGNYQCARLPSTLCIIHKSQKTDCIFLSFDPERGIGRELLRTHDGCHDWSLSPDGRTLTLFLDGHSIRFFSVKNGVAKEDKTITLNEWLIPDGDWTADGKGLLIPSVTPAGTPVILEVNRAGKASVVLEGTASISLEYVIHAPDGRRGIVEAVVPGDNNAWMIDTF